MLTLGAPMLILLLNDYLQYWLLQCNHITYLYEGKKNLSRVDKKKITILPIISTLSPSKDHQKVIKKQPDPSPNITKSSEILLVPGDDEMIQYTIPINKSVP